MKAYDESGLLEASAESSQQETVPAHPLECARTRFYVHVYGPDDMLPMETWEKALEEANALNAFFVKQRETATDNDPVMYAIAEKVEG